jgi:predicted metal-dependent hydrolase
VITRCTRDTVTLSGPVGEAAACLAALNRWLQSRAKERLLPLLASHAQTTGLHYRKAGIRGQRSRWGACSTSGSITLNRCLLFLPPELVDSVVLHELAHLVQPNHSVEFWRELRRLDPSAHDHRKAIRGAWSVVPIWAEPWVLRRR